MDDFEDRLHHYRPIGPPRDLRARILEAVSRDVPVHQSAADALREWIPAAAALVLAVMLFWLAANERRGIQSHLMSASAVEQSESAVEEGQR